MKILVTGGAGFIGSTIVDEYVKLGHKVVIIDNLSSGKKKNINPRARFYKCDIGDAARVGRIFRKERFDVVTHHAAQIDVRRSVADPVFDARVNVLGTLVLLENCRAHGVKKVIFASSGGTIYGECGRIPPTELSPGRPLSPYGITKHCVEFYLKYYAALFGLKYTVLRYSNVYGPRQDPHGEAGVVAIFSQRILNNEEIKIFGDGKQLRDYVYVADVARANVLALTRGTNEIINIGTRKASSVNDLYRAMAAVTGYAKKPVYKPARPGELFRSFLDAGKARRVLGWQPRVSFSEGLLKTIEYFKTA